MLGTSALVPQDIPTATALSCILQSLQINPDISPTLAPDLIFPGMPSRQQEVNLYGGQGVAQGQSTCLECPRSWIPSQTLQISKKKNINTSLDTQESFRVV